MNWLASGISEAFIWAFLDDLRYPNLQKKKDYKEISPHTGHNVHHQNIYKR